MAEGRIEEARDHLARAIALAIGGADTGDTVLLAGKGHETGQTVGDRTLPFSDHEAVRAALEGEAA